MRGFFGIGIENNKSEVNVGTLWRSAHNLGAAFIFTIGRRYKRQSSDTTKAYRSVPLYGFEDFDHFYKSMPYDCLLVGLEYPNDKSLPLHDFNHPERCVYLLGSEDSGLSKKALDKCHKLAMIPGSKLNQSLNVAVAGSIIMYDRLKKNWP